MRRVSAVMVAAAAVTGVGCGDVVAPPDATIVLLASRQVISAGSDSAFLSAVVHGADGMPVIDNTCVTFTTTLGTLRRTPHPNAADRYGGDDPIGNGHRFRDGAYSGRNCRSCVPSRS